MSTASLPRKLRSQQPVGATSLIQRTVLKMGYWFSSRWLYPHLHLLRHLLFSRQSNLYPSKTRPPLDKHWKYSNDTVSEIRETIHSVRNAAHSIAYFQSNLFHRLITFRHHHPTLLYFSLLLHCLCLDYIESQLHGFSLNISVCKVPDEYVLFTASSQFAKCPIQACVPNTFLIVVVSPRNRFRVRRVGDGYQCFEDHSSSGIYNIKRERVVSPLRLPTNRLFTHT